MALILRRPPDVWEKTCSHDTLECMCTCKDDTTLFLFPLCIIFLANGIFRSGGQSRMPITLRPTPTAQLLCSLYCSPRPFLLGRSDWQSVDISCHSRSDLTPVALSNPGRARCISVIVMRRPIHSQSFLSAFFRSPHGVISRFPLPLDSWSFDDDLTQRADLTLRAVERVVLQTRATRHAAIEKGMEKRWKL